MSESNRNIKKLENNMQSNFMGIFVKDPEEIANKLSRPITPFYEIKENYNTYTNIQQANQEDMILIYKGCSIK